MTKRLLTERERDWCRAIEGSEDRLLATIGQFEDYGDYEVIRTDRFPAYYAGNGILIRDLGAGDLDFWIGVFHRHFPNPPYRHVTFTFPVDTEDRLLIDQATAAGFVVSEEVLMATESSVVANPAHRRAEHTPRLLNGEADQEALYQLQLAEAREEDWFVDEGDFDMLFGKSRVVSEGAGIRWLGVDRSVGSGLASALGFFDHEGICRLQEVMTAPDMRGKGMATSLIVEAARLAAARGTPAIGLIADRDGDAIRLYRRLGFTDLADDTSLMLY